MQTQTGTWLLSLLPERGSSAVVVQGMEKRVRLLLQSCSVRWAGPSPPLRASVSPSMQKASRVSQLSEMQPKCTEMGHPWAPSGCRDCSCTAGQCGGLMLHCWRNGVKRVPNLHGYGVRWAQRSLFWFPELIFSNASSLLPAWSYTKPPPLPSFGTLSPCFCPERLSASLSRRQFSFKSP